MKRYRLERVAEVVREVAATTILFDLRDPRVKNVTVTRAEVSADLQHAKVFVSVMGSEKEQQLTMHGLKSAAGFVQTKVAERLTSRYVPHITFVLDEGVKKSVEVARIIREENEQLAADRAAAGLGETEDTEPGETAPGTTDHAEQPGPADGSANQPD
jgi:ribosome-binding factor A